jgi:peroxiredoxin/uncharacterized membrane protein YphA (DoxX/SURF4 family)
MTAVLMAIRLLLAGVFATAAVTKLADRGGGRGALDEFGVPAPVAPALAILLPVAELAIAAALIPNASARWAAAFAAGLLGLFAAAIGFSLARGRQPDCHCFGQLHSRPAGPVALFRNLGLIALAGLVVWEPSGDLGGLQIAVIVLGAGLLLQTWFGYQLLRQNGRVLARLERVEAAGAVGTSPQGPRVTLGAPASHFSLPTVAGGEISLESLLARGRPVLLAFVDIGCHSCRVLLPQLAEWQRRRSDALTVVVVSHGGAEENAAWAGEHDLDLVVLQPGNALSALYGVNATPSAILVGADGRIASAAAEGAEAIARLTGGSLRADDGESTRAAERSRASAVAAVATVAIVGGAATAPSAVAADPERDAIRGLIDAAQPGLDADNKALKRAFDRYSSSLTPKHSAVTAVLRAISNQQGKLAELREAVAGSTLTTPAGIDAQRLVLETIDLTRAYLNKLVRGVRSKDGAAALRSLSASRKLLDQSLQRGIDAQGALTSA